MDELDVCERPDEPRWDRAIEAQERTEQLLAAGELDEAERLQRRVVEELDAAVGPGHPDAAHARTMLAALLEHRGALVEAGELLDTALLVLERWIDEQAAWPLLLSALQHKAANARSRGDFAGGRATLERAAALASECSGPRSLELALIANERGVLEKLAGRLDEAHAYYRRCRETLEALGHELPASLWHNLAGLACARDDFKTAEALALEAIEARQREDGGESLALATDWAGLADARAGLGQLDEAAAGYREALRLLERTGNEAHPELAYLLHNLADAEAERGRAAEAEALYRRAIARKLELFGAVHHELAASRNNLAALWAELGHGAEALAESRRAVEAAASCPVDHPVRVACEQLLAELERRC